MKLECTCLQYCWEHSLAPWVRNVPMIRTILLPAIDAYLSIAHISSGTILSNVTDLSTVAFKPFSSSTVSVLPLIPHVSVQYRCGDNIGFGKVKYGVSVSDISFILNHLKLFYLLLTISLSDHLESYSSYSLHVCDIHRSKVPFLYILSYTPWFFYFIICSVTSVLFCSVLFCPDTTFYSSTLPCFYIIFCQRLHPSLMTALIGRQHFDVHILMSLTPP